MLPTIDTLNHRQGMGIIATLFLILPLFSFLFFPLSAQSATDDFEQMRQEEKAKLQEEINQSHIQIEQLQISLESHQSEMEEAKEQEQSVLAEIEELDQKLNKMGSRYLDFQKKTTDEQEHLKNLEDQLDKVRKENDLARQRMQGRIMAYYKVGKIDILNIFFSAKTLPDLLRFHDAFQNVIAYDKKIMEHYHETISNLETATQSVSIEKDVLQDMVSNTKEKENDILEVRKEKEKLLSEIQNKASLHQKAIDEMQKATQNLAETMLTLKKKEEHFDQGFYLNKGKHIAPVDGTIINLFNDKVQNQFGEKKVCLGISIDTIDGSSIKAIFDGTIIFSGYLRGYGNTIIIDHGHDYYTVTSRIQTLIGRKDATVKKDDIIGLAGSTATINDKGVYFEIRYKDKPLDPLQWLDTSKLSFAPGKKPQKNQ